MNDRRIVYSTDQGRVAAPKQQPSRPAAAPSTGPALPDDGVVRIFREKNHRGGKTVTVVRGLPEKGPALDARATDLKRLCGAGGTVREGAVEIQGDHREKVAERLRTLGYKVKLAGG